MKMGTFRACVGREIRCPFTGGECPIDLNRSLVMIVAIAVPMLMVIAWLIHIAICWHWDFKEWWHSSDEDI